MPANPHPLKMRIRRAFGRISWLAELGARPIHTEPVLNRLPLVGAVLVGPERYFDVSNAVTFTFE